MKDNDPRRAPRNPSIAEIRLHCLDLAVRGALLTGRANDFMTQAQQYFEWVHEPAAGARAGAAPAALTIEQILARVPKGMLRTAAELKEKGLNRAELIAAAKPPAAVAPPADLDDDEPGSQGHEGGGGEMGRGPASLRQAEG